MTMHSLPHDAISIAHMANASERALVLRDVLRSFDEQPETLSQADEQNLLEWAERLYVASRRNGPYALMEAKARKAAAAYVRACHQEDQSEGREVQDHFERGLRAYFATLQQVCFAEAHKPHRNGWLRIEDLDRGGSVVGQWDYCPDCAVAQRSREALAGARLPEPHEKATEYHGTRYTELRGDDSHLLCCRCQPQPELLEV